MSRSLAQQKFGAAAADYAASPVHAAGPSLERLLALVDPQTHWRVLDVATGAGHTALTLAPHVDSVVASDITDEMLAEAEKLSAARGATNVTTAHAEAAALPFADATFDLVTCRLAAHHFTDPAGFVAEALRVLKLGGRFALIDNVSPDPMIMPGEPAASIDAAEQAYNSYEKLRDPSHARCLSVSEWLALLDRSGFKLASYELLDQDIAFEPWTARMRCCEATIAQLGQMLQEEPLRTFLRPREIDGSPAFTLQEAIIIATKPVT
jgi:ubiquinone/menaquinone biosynthesis C-methylase UbiE